jgi:hypothetical protein
MVRWHWRSDRSTCGREQDTWTLPPDPGVWSQGGGGGGAGAGRKGGVAHFRTSGPLSATTTSCTVPNRHRSYAGLGASPGGTGQKQGQLFVSFYYSRWVFVGDLCAVLCSYTCRFQIAIQPASRGSVQHYDLLPRSARTGGYSFCWELGPENPGQKKQNRPGMGVGISPSAGGRGGG